MAKVRWSAGIDSVSGALAKPNKKSSQHSCGDYLIGKHRVAPTLNSDCNRLYLHKSDVYKRSTVPSAREMQARLRFKTVSQNVAERKIDLTRMSQDQQAFLAQKDQPGGIRTLLAWYWKQEGDAYDAQHGN